MIINLVEVLKHVSANSSEYCGSEEDKHAFNAILDLCIRLHTIGKEKLLMENKPLIFTRYVEIQKEMINSFMEHLPHALYTSYHEIVLEKERARLLDLFEDEDKNKQ